MSAYRIHRYIVREVATPTGVGLLIFTFVLLMGRILKLVEMVINKGVAVTEIAKLFAYLLPAFLVITIPLAFLLGVLLGFGRLSADGEIVALKASGVNLYGMMKSVVGLALVCCTATALLTLHAEPAGNAAFRDQVFQLASSRASIGIQPQIFNDEFDGLVLYADDLDEQSGAMKGVFISDERVGFTPAVILASKGRVISDKEKLALTLRLEDGAIHRRPADRDHDAYQVISFTTYDVNLNMGQQLASAEERPKKTRELTTGELLRARQKAADGEEERALTVALHKRLVLPLAPLIFALIGVPLGIQSQRSGKGGGFATALLVFMCYYILISFAETLALDGGWPAVATLWAPNLLFFLGGFYLLHLAAMERRIALAERGRDLFRQLRSFVTGVRGSR